MSEIRLGIALDNILNERWNKEVVIIKNNITKHKGVTFTKTAFGKHETQLQNVQDLIDSNEINTLLLVPVDGDRAEEIVNLAKTNNVKVILYSRPINKGKVDFVIKFDVIGIGESQAQFISDNKKGNNTIIIHGPKSDLNSITLLEGQMKVLSPLIEENKINLIDTYYLESWTKIKAETTVKQVFNKHKDTEIHNIISANDMIAEAASEYVEKNNLSMPTITGLDAELNACKRILSDKQSMTVALLPTTIAQCASDVVTFLNGSNPDLTKQYKVQTGFFGFQSHKTINTNCEVITKGNLKEIVAREKLFPANWL